MIYGFDNGKWWIEYQSCRWSPGNMREESDKRALEIGQTSKKIMLSLSGGIDSQSMLLSFQQQDIPVECAFLYLPGFNDHEYKNLKLVEDKYNIKAHIIDINVLKIKDELEEEAELYDIQINSILQKKFLSLLPDDYDFVQMVHDPYVHITPQNEPYWFQGYNSFEMVRHRAFELLNRKGKFIFFGDTSEFLSSILSEEVLWSCIYSWPYFKGNGLTKGPEFPHVYLDTTDRWDYYIKPLIYGKYWKDELLYFPKWAGFENIPFMLTELKIKEHALMIPLKPFLNFLLTTTNETKRFYQTIHKPSTNC
jgi:hypothetical protein